MQQMSTIQGNLAAIAKDCDQAQKKADKANAKGSKVAAGRVADASDEIDNALQQWESQAPYVFEQLQAVDETRLNFLRDVLTQLETHEVDHVEKAKGQAESCLNALLSVNVADEIKAWSLKKTDGAHRTRVRIPAPQRAPSRDERLETSPSTSRMERRMSRNISVGNSLAPPSTLETNGEDRTSQREPSISEEKKKPRGLRRLGTVFGKKRQSIMPGFGRPTPGRHKSARLGSTTDLNEDQAQPEPPVPPPPAKDIRSANPLGASRSNQSQSEMSIPQRNTSYQSMTNGTRRLQEPLVPANTLTDTGRSAPPQPAQVQPQPENTPSTAANDTFATPPTSASAVDPITLAQREAAAAGSDNGYEDASETASQQQQNAFNLSIRNAPIAEESSAANSAAMENVANTLRAQAPTPTRRAGTLRGRRDVRNTVFIPSEQAPVFENAAGGHPPAASPFTPALRTAAIASTQQFVPRPTTASEDHNSDNQSVRSGRSLGSTIASGSAPVVRHPDMHTPGLASSIIETVNATFEAGKLTSGSVTGELALSYTPSPTSTAAASSRDTIRLENFPVLEKVAPNPAFVHDIGQSSTNRKGEYTIDLQSLSARPSVAFKYQLHNDPTNPASTLNRHAPLSFTPSWKCEQSQTSVIVQYGLNSSFTGVASGEVILHNVILALYLEGAKTVTCQTKPSGTFSKDKAMVFWRFDELKLSAASGGSKVLARFGTDGEGKPGRVEARWEIQGGAARDGVLGVSRLERVGNADPFADEGGISGSWGGVSGSRKTIAGGYIGT